MQVTIRKNNLMFLGLFLINLLMSIVAYYVLPKRFFYDSLIIVLDEHNEIGLFGSYPFAILFYYVTGLRYLPYPIVAMIQYPLIVYILYKLGVPSNFDKINARNILIYISFFMMALFISMPSKEFITFLFVTAIPFIFQSTRIGERYKIPLCFLVFAIMGIFFRIYFLLVPVLAFGMYIVSFIKLENRTSRTIFLGVMCAVTLSLLHGAIKGEYLSASRETVNSARTVNQDANSMISPPLKPNTWYGEAVAIVYGFVAVNFPIEGFKHILSPQIIAFIIWQLMVIYILLVRLSKGLQDRKHYKYLIWTLLFLFGYFIVQGMFEPDLGAAVRHKMGLFPLVYYAFYYEYIRREVQ